MYADFDIKTSAKKDSGNNVEHEQVIEPARVSQKGSPTESDRA
jgi:hypothetical protein